jgi:hypothetical protein
VDLKFGRNLWNGLKSGELASFRRKQTFLKNLTKIVYLILKLTQQNSGFIIMLLVKRDH